MQLEQNIRVIATSGKCSWFGGPHDTGMKPTEPVSIYNRGESDPYSLFVPGAGRLGHDLNPDALYIAMRWDYEAHPRLMLKHSVLAVFTLQHTKPVYVHPADWGPNPNTGRVCDLSPGALRALGVTTDSVVHIVGLYDASQL